MFIAHRYTSTAIASLLLLSIATTSMGARSVTENTTIDEAARVKNIVLVHGAFVDGSGWRGVYDRLTKDGYHVTIVPIATASLAEDVATTRRALAAQDGPCLLVGHSYGGVVITEAGSASNVVGLVYIAAFAPDAGESVASMAANAPAGSTAPPILPPQDGGLLVDRAKFHSAFAADLDVSMTAFMADAQIPWGLAAFSGSVSMPAWRTKPSWYLIATGDRMIDPNAQRGMSQRAKSTTVEVEASHAVYVSQPRRVAELISRAAASAGMTAASR